MTVTILHIADIHLGYQQYGSATRFNDFGRSFIKAAEYAIEREVDFVIIAGDLFHKATIDPSTLLQAVNALDKLRGAGIQVVAVAGNHDRARYKDAYSWLYFLSERGYLALLSPTFKEDGIELASWDGYDGAYIDIKGVRVIGVPYLGSGIHAIMDELSSAIKRLEDPAIRFTILMFHAGISGEMPRISGGLHQNELAELSGVVDYIALGHLHKPFEREEWIYNPGSLEICGMDERRWRGGYYHVSVGDLDQASLQARHQARHVKHPHRNFYRFDFSVDEYRHFEELLEALKLQLEIESDNFTSKELSPVLEISLSGVIDFEYAELDIDRIKQAADEILSPTIPTRVRNVTRPLGFDMPLFEHGSRPELEKAIFKELALRDHRFKEHADQLSSLMTDIKKETLTGSAPELIIARVKKWLLDLEDGVTEEE
jgi:exonuclease SbcD